MHYGESEKDTACRPGESNPGGCIFGTSQAGREKFDYVFMDPPYNHMLEKEVLTYLAKSDLLEKDALIIVEASLATDFSYLEELGFLMIKQKKYKTNMHVFISVEE